jgi:hypothetical protein
VPDVCQAVALSRSIATEWPRARDLRFTEVVSNRLARHPGRPRFSPQINEPMIRIPTLRGIASLLRSLSNLRSHGNQFRYKRRNILDHHLSFPWHIVVAHRAVLISKFLVESVARDLRFDHVRRQHLVIHFSLRWHLRDVLEIAEVLTRLFIDSGAVVLLGFLVSGDLRLTSTPERGRNPLRAHVTREDETRNLGSGWSFVADVAH